MKTIPVLRVLLAVNAPEAASQSQLIDKVYVPKVGDPSENASPGAKYSPDKVREFQS